MTLAEDILKKVHAHVYLSKHSLGLTWPSTPEKSCFGCMIVDNQISV